MKALGWSYKIPLKEGIKKAYNDFLKQIKGS
jgi:nucleoside-diphosphate-sugar epimerase